jgi:hypothetical protein
MTGREGTPDGASVAIPSLFLPAIRKVKSSSA